MFLFSEPEKPLYKKDLPYDEVNMCAWKVVPKKFSNWDKIHLNGPMTVGDVMEHVKAEYKVEVDMIVAPGNV